MKVRLTVTRTIQHVAEIEVEGDPIHTAATAEKIREYLKKCHPDGPDYPAWEEFETWSTTVEEQRVDEWDDEETWHDITGHIQP